MDRLVLHCDLNNFYATVECRNHPELRDYPVAVCGSIEDRHGVILAKNERAKAFGVRTGEVVWQARMKCPELLLLRPHFQDYLYWSRQARKIYGRYTDQVEPFGIDECWLDVTGSTALFGTGEEMAHRIRREIKAELGLTISVGVSYNKVFAKLGSDLKKPDAVSLVTRESYREQIWPLEAGALLGVGRATQSKLSRVGILTIGDLAQARPDSLKRMLGKNGEVLWRYANGFDNAPVLRENEIPPVKTVGNSTTCTRDLDSPEEVWKVLLLLGETVSARLREERLNGGNVTLSVKDTRLATVEYSKRLRMPQRGGKALAQAAMELFEERYDWQWKVRALGIRAGELVTDCDVRQLSLFVNPGQVCREECLEGKVDDLRGKFGRDIIRRASLLGETAAASHCGRGEDSMPTFHSR